ncbi:MAG: Phage tail protein [bacterium P3]|nr:MAG: Phage tail protein [bacterium P3]KWW42680.1 MAG: Phage tail protein [bacterium F083]
MPADRKTDFIQKWNEFLSIFDSDGTQRLMVDVQPTKPLVYEVYLEDEMDAEKRWSDSAMVGTFTIKLKEPDPVKRVNRLCRQHYDDKQ